MGLALTVYSGGQVQDDLASHLVAAVAEELGRQVSLHLIVIRVSETTVPRGQAPACLS